MVAALIFDLDGVVRNRDLSIVSDAERRHGLPAGSIAQVAFEPATLSAVITGRTTDEQWRAAVAATLADAHGPGAHAAVAQWSVACGTVNAEVLEIVRTERRARRVALLTNATSRLGNDLAALGIDAEFDAVFNSAEMGVAKPDPGAFALACAGLGVEARGCLFVDDNAPNVEGARRIGLRAHRFETVQGLSAFLRAHQSDAGAGPVPD